MYVEPSFKSKKAFKDAVKAGERVTVFQPGGLFPATTDGVAFIEGPNFVPHTWYAQVTVVDGVVTKVVK